jgi:outer membrane protein TolC
VAEQRVATARQNSQASDDAGLPVVTLSHMARVSDNPLDAFADKLYTRQVTSADFDPARLNEPGSTDLWLTQLQVRWPLYTGGKLQGQQQQAQAGVKQSEHQYKRAQQQTAFFTMQTYLMAIAAKFAGDISSDAVTAAAQHARTTAELAKQERIVESDKLAAAVNLAAVRAQHEKSRTRTKHAYTRLRQLLGYDGDSELTIVSSWPEIPHAEQDIAVLTQQSLELRTDLDAAKSGVQAAAANVDVATAANKPSVDVVASSSWYDDNPGFDSQASSLMAIASFNLYDGSKQGKIGAARAQHKEQQWRVTELEQTVRAEVQQAFDDLAESHKRLAIAKDNVALAKRATSLVKQRYGQGRTILLDLLQAERMLTDSRVEKLAAELAIRINQLALQYATGTLALPAGEAD